MKRTPEIESRIVELIANGCSYAESAAAVGIHRDTFRVWRKIDPAFSAVIKKAEAEAVAKMVGTITKAAEKTWQAAAWWLERKYPGRYAKREPRAVNPYAVAAHKWEPVPPGEWEGEAAVDLIEKMIDYGAPPELVEHAQRLRDELIERESRRDYLPYSERRHETANVEC